MLNSPEDEWDDDRLGSSVLVTCCVLVMTFLIGLALIARAMAG